MALEQKDLEQIERILYKNSDDVAVSIARSFERMEERIDAAEARLYTLGIEIVLGLPGFLSSFGRLAASPISVSFMARTAGVGVEATLASTSLSPVAHTTDGLWRRVQRRTD
jgi:hypothetical protein